MKVNGLASVEAYAFGVERSLPPHSISEPLPDRPSAVARDPEPREAQATR